MLDPKDAARATAKDACDAAEAAADLSAGASPGTESLLRVQAIWETARAEVKGRLEAVIRKLAEEPLATFEEKRERASILMQAIDRWGFRVLSPDGYPSIFRCGKSRGMPQGYFSFARVGKVQENSQSENSNAVDDRNSEGSYAQMPQFSLVDKPPDRRRRQPEASSVLLQALSELAGENLPKDDEAAKARLEGFISDARMDPSLTFAEKTRFVRDVNRLLYALDCRIELPDGQRALLHVSRGRSPAKGNIAFMTGDGNRGGFVETPIRVVFTAGSDGVDDSRS